MKIREKKVYGLKSLESSDKHLPFIKDFIHPEIINELERIEEEEEKNTDRNKIFTS